LWPCGTEVDDEVAVPPTDGLGLDCLVMAMTGKRSIREVVPFPAIRG